MSNRILLAHLLLFVAMIQINLADKMDDLNEYANTQLKNCVYSHKKDNEVFEECKTQELKRLEYHTEATRFCYQKDPLRGKFHKSWQMLFEYSGIWNQKRTKGLNPKPYFNCVYDELEKSTGNAHRAIQELKPIINKCIAKYEARKVESGAPKT